MVSKFKELFLGVNNFFLKIESNAFLSKYRYYLLFIIILFGLYLRLMYLGYDSLWFDENISASVAKSITQNGYYDLESGAEYSRAYLFHYGMAFFLILFGINDFSARFISVIFGAMTILFAYYFSKLIFKENEFRAIIFSLFVSISSLFVMYSMQARFYMGFTLFYFLTFYLFYRIVILKKFYFKNKFFDYLLIGSSGFLAYHLQVMGLVIVPLLFFVYVIHNIDYLKDNFSLKKVLKRWYVIFVGLICLIVGVYLVFRFVGSISSLFNVLNIATIYYSIYSKYLVLFVIAFIGMVYGLIYSNWKFHISFIVYSFVPIIGIFLTEQVGSRYIFFAFFALFFYIAYIISQLEFRSVVVVFTIVLLSSTIFTFTPIKEPNLDPSAPQADYKGAYKYVDSIDDDFNLIVTFTPATMWYLDSSPDFWIKYSISGRSNETWTVHRADNGVVVDRFAGAQVIDSVEELPKEFVLVLDNQATKKVDSSYLSYFNSNCNVEFSSFNIEVFKCE